MSKDQVQLLVTPKAKGDWVSGEAVCVSRKGKRLACGRVEESNAYGARVTVTLTSGQDILFGDLVHGTEETSQVYHIMKDQKRIVITHKPDRSWKMGDSVCVFRKLFMVACGEVIETDGFTAQVDIHVSDGKINEGDWVKEAQTKSRVLEVDAEKTHISISQFVHRPWEIMDKVEVLQRDKRVALAIVTGVEKDKIKARIIWKEKEVRRGDWVRFDEGTIQVDEAPKKVVKMARSISSVVTKVGDCMLYFFEGQGMCSSNLTVGMNTLSPTVRLDMAFQKHFSVGFMPLYFSTSAGDASLGGVGALATLAYYPERAFQGLWLQMGLGLYFLSAQLNNTSESVLTPAVITTLGWRWLWNSGFNMGVGLGAHYLLFLGTNTVRLTSSGFIPAAAVDIGWKF